MLMYLSRKNGLFKEMERAKFNLPSEGKGYLLLRDAMLGPRAWDTINTWTQGSYDYALVQKCMKKQSLDLLASIDSCHDPMAGLQYEHST